MALQLSTAVRNAILEAIELTVNGQTLNAGAVTGTAAAPKLRLYTGAPPANPAAAATGTLLVEITLPADWMGNASGGTKLLNGTWQGTASASGTAGHYRLVDNAGTTCHDQGTVTLTAGGGDMTLDNTNIATGQTVSVSSKTLTAPNA